MGKVKKAVTFDDKWTEKEEEMGILFFGHLGLGQWLGYCCWGGIRRGRLFDLRKMVSPAPWRSPRSTRSIVHCRKWLKMGRFGRADTVKHRSAP